MPTTPQMPTPGDQECPSGNWDVWGDNCLLIRPNDYRTWDEALRYVVLIYIYILITWG